MPFFDGAVDRLLSLRAKPIERFVGRFSPAKLREAGDFLLAIALAEEKAAA